MKWLVPALCAILLAPLALVDMPPLLDYPNHLARATVLAFGAADPILSRIYAAHWAIIPNLGIDLLLPPLLHVLPVHVAGRIVIGVAILLPFLGTIAYSRAVFGARSLWPLASALVACNATLLLGFLNFTASLGLALLLAAAWIEWRERYPARIVLLAAIGAVALFFCHLMGLFFFYALIAGFELEWLWPRRSDASAVATRIVALVALSIAPLALYAASPLASLAGNTEWLSLHDKLWQLVFPFSNYKLPLDVATAGLVAAFLIACLATGHCRVPLRSGSALVALVLLYAALPFASKGTYFLDTRCVIMFGFLLFGAVLPAGLPRLAGSAATAVFAALFAIRIAVLATAWHGHQRDVADLRAVIATVQPGARVFVASVSPEEAPEYWRNSPLSRRLSYGNRLELHLPALLLIEHRAFWPFLFDNPSQQPVETLSPYRALAERARSIPDHHRLDTPGTFDLCGYDHLLLLEAGGEPDLGNYAADRLSLLARSDIAALFRVRPSACAWQGSSPEAGSHSAGARFDRPASGLP